MGESPGAPGPWCPLLPRNLGSHVLQLPTSRKPGLCPPPFLSLTPSPPGPSPTPRPSSLGPRLPPHSPQTWEQQDHHTLFPMHIPGFAAESEARAQRPAEAQGAVGPGPRRAGGDGPGGVVVVPLQQPLPQPPAQGGGGLGLGGAVAVQPLTLPGAGGGEEPRGICGREKGQWCLFSPGPRQPVPQGSAHSQTTERCRETC